MEQYIGKLLDERYEILSVLGTGGMAVVYKAKDRRLNRMVAVKILKEELAEDEEICNRFHDESQAVGMMNHPNIVNVFDVSQTDEVEYIVMELIEGITLKQYMINRGGQLNWREALHFTVQILQALRHAHSRGIIHRDIKPQNIMVLRDGSVKVADFGIARILGNQQRTMTQETIGSVHYISPEQARGSDIDARSDLYSAGVVLYEMLTGRLPFEGDSPVAVAIQHINCIPVAPRELNTDIPVGMEQITMKAMAPNRERRYISAEEMLKDLDAFRKQPDIVFPYDNPWTPGDDPNDPKIVRRTPLRTVPAVQAQPEEPESEKLPQEEYDEEELEEKGSKRTIVFIIGAVLAILIVILFIIYILWSTVFSSIFATGDTFDVPDLRGKTVTEASQYLFEDETYTGHFTISVSDDTVYDASYEPDEIVQQDPAMGTKVKGETITITVVLCAEQQEEAERVMPDILGKDYQTWATTLEDEYGVKVRYDARYSDSVDKNLIISTDPTAGTTLTEGQTVWIYYSKGEETKTVTMITLIGMSESKAKSALKEMGLSVGKVVTVESGEDEGTVVQQSVKTGAEVEEGTKVNLQVSSGPPKEDEKEEEIPAADDTQPNEDGTTQDGTDGTDDTQDTTPDTEEDTAGNDEQLDNNPPEDDAEVHQVTVNLPSGREEDVQVVVTINGKTEYDQSAAKEATSISFQYQGNIESMSITVDGEDYSDVDVT